MDRPPASRISASSSRENGENARIRPLRCPLYVYPRLNLPRFFVPFSIEFERHTFSFGLLDRSVSSLYSSLVNANEIYMPSTLCRKDSQYGGYTVSPIYDSVSRYLRAQREPRFHRSSSSPFALESRGEKEEGAHLRKRSRDEDDHQTRAKLVLP